MINELLALTSKNLLKESINGKNSNSEKFESDVKLNLYFLK